MNAYESTSLDDLGDLEYVGLHLFISKTNINNFGHLKYVGGILYVGGTPLSMMYSKDDIREVIDVKGAIYM